MEINRRLNLVVPITREKDTIYVHSSPISLDVFKANFKVIGRTFETLNTLFGPTSGPRVAAMTLDSVATDLGLEAETQSLKNEMRRLSNVIVPTNAGWETIPLQDALDKKLINDEDASEVENAIVFFTVAYATLNRAQRGGMVKAAAELWGAQITSSNFTEWTHSLKTSTETVSSGAKSPAPVKKDRATANATVDGKPSSIPS